MEAILSATAMGGEIMMHPDELGKVLPGYYADLILVNGNPSEDIKLLSGHKHIDMVLIVSNNFHHWTRNAPLTSLSEWSSSQGASSRRLARGGAGVLLTARSRVAEDQRARG